MLIAMLHFLFTKVTNLPRGNPRWCISESWKVCGHNSRYHITLQEMIIYFYSMYCIQSQVACWLASWSNRLSHFQIVIDNFHLWSEGSVFLVSLQALSAPAFPLTGSSTAFLGIQYVGKISIKREGSYIFNFLPNDVRLIEKRDSRSQHMTPDTISCTPLK